MIDIAKKFFLVVFMIYMIMFLLTSCSNAHAGELSVGVSEMPAGHSEGATTRCMNSGFGVDLEYTVPLTYNFHKYVGVELTPGGMLTYSNFETAFRLGAGQPESKQKRESAVTLTATLRPTVRVWKLRAYKLFGFGVDYNQPDNTFGLGRLQKGQGLGFDFTDTMAIDISERKFLRYDGTFYRYNTATFTYSF